MLLAVTITMTATPASPLPADSAATVGDTITPPSATVDSVLKIPNYKLIAADSIASARGDRNWWHLLKKGQLDLKDTTVVYPRFLGFCVKAYNWGNEFLNGTDQEYVEGTGRRWKVFIKSDNWVDSYAMNLGHLPIRVMSDIYCNGGAYLQYMAVSVGYSIDFSNVIGNKVPNHKKFEFSFSCQRFSVDAYYNENTGGSYLRTFANYRNGKLFKKPFPGVTLYTYGIDAYYFFNNRRYSQGAAYNFSRYQRRRAGSLIVGFSYSNIDISMDLAQLPYPLMYYLSIPAQTYRFHYNAYTLTVGYGYNWVPGKHWTINLTVLPLFGVNECYEDSFDGSQLQLSLGIKGKSSVVYNVQDFFAGIQARFDGHWYRSNDISFFSSIENLAAIIGLRF